MLLFLFSFNKKFSFSLRVYLPYWALGFSYQSFLAEVWSLEYNNHNDMTNSYNNNDDNRDDNNSDNDVASYSSNNNNDNDNNNNNNNNC